MGGIIAPRPKAPSAVRAAQIAPVPVAAATIDTGNANTTAEELQVRKQKSKAGLIGSFVGQANGQATLGSNTLLGS